MTTAELRDHDWEHLASDTKYLTHSIHRYSGKFIPQIARQAVEICTRPGDLVVDPYAGSGTTLLEAWLSGRRAIGVDLNPLAVLIAQVKVTPVSPEVLRGLLVKSRAHVALLASAGEALPFDECLTQADDPRLHDPWYTKWFAAERLQELLQLDSFVRSLDDPRAASVARLALSDILRRSSFANTSYPNVMFDKNRAIPSSAYPIFLSRLGEICRAVAELAHLEPATDPPSVVHGDARTLPVRDETVDAVVTHPPYIGSIPYAEYGSLSIKWLGYEPKSLDAQLTGGQRQRRDVVPRFEESYGEMFQEACRVLKPGALMFLMVGSPTVRGELIDLPSMSNTLASKSGLDLVDQHHRRGGNRRANKMVGEELMLFRKS